jgi:hypothetical protein
MADRWHVEAWSLPLATSTRTVARVPFSKGSAAVAVGGSAGRGAITVRKDWDRLAEVTDPENGVGSLFRIYRDNTLIPELSFFGRRDARNLDDEAEGQVVISGPGIGDVMNFARVENFDYPVSPTVDPDWSYGAAGDLVAGFSNASFEDVKDAGTDFEDETLQGWEVIPASGDFRASDAAPVPDNGDARTGSWSLLMDPGLRHSGVQRTLRVIAGERYQFQAFCKSTTTGKRFTFGVTTVATAFHTNAFTYNGITMAELGNVPSNGLGTPGGSTDGTWQQLDLDVTIAGTAGESVTITLYMQFDDHDGTNGPLARWDDITFTGPGLGLVPWEPTSDTALTTFLQDPTPGSPPISPFDGDNTVHLVTTASGGGVRQKVEGLTIGRTVTFIAYIHHDTGSSQNHTITIQRAEGLTTLSSATVFVATGGTWTRLSTTALIDTEDVYVVVTKNTTGEFWADATRLTFGQDQASWGDIHQQLLDDAAVDHTAESPPFDRDTLGFLDYTSFTTLLDSAGNTWSPATVDYRAKRGKKYRQIGADGAKMGFETIVRDTAAGPVLEIFNPYDWSTRTGGIGTDRTGTGVPEIVYGAGVTSGPIVRQPSTANRWHIEGEAGQFEVRRDLASIADYDTREGYEGSVDFLENATLGQIADQALAERTIPTTALKVNLAPHEGDNVPVPFRDFNIGDTYPLNLIGDFVGPKRVMQITVDFSPGIGFYTVEFDQITYTSDPLKATIEAVRRLLEQADTLDQPADQAGPAADVTVPGRVITDSYLVASQQHSRPEIVERADFTTDQVADHIEINAAFGAILPDGVPGTGGQNATVVLAAGRYEISDTVTITDFATLTGTGRGSNFNPVTGTEFELQASAEIAHLTFVAE